MQVVKITNNQGVFYTDKVDENKDREGAEVIEMAEEEYRQIPATASASEFFGS